MCRLTAEGLGSAPEEVLVCSTGLIGSPADGRDRAGHPVVAARAGRAGGERTPPWASSPPTRRARRCWSASSFLAGMAKGAGMLAPNMATMLAFLTTDAAVEPGPLADLLGPRCRFVQLDVGRRVQVDQRHRGPDGLGPGRTVDPNVLATP